MKSNRYFAESEFLRLKKLLSETSEIKFFHTDINDLPYLIREKYDSMFLSNISTYQNNTRFIKLLKNGIFSTDEIAATNGLQQEPKSVTRFLQRINKLLKDNDIFIAAPEKHHYYLNAQGFYQNIIII